MLKCNIYKIKRDYFYISIELKKTPSDSIVQGLGKNWTVIGTLTVTFLNVVS